jgi:hypothetical protein
MHKINRHAQVGVRGLAQDARWCLATVQKASSDKLPLKSKRTGPMNPAVVASAATPGDLCHDELKSHASPYVLDDDENGLVGADADVDLTDASGENTSSRASSAPMSRPVTRGTAGTRPQSSGSIFLDDGATQDGCGDSELPVSVKRLVGAAKDRSASSSSHNMEVIMELYEQTKISTSEAQKNPSCIN